MFIGFCACPEGFSGTTCGGEPPTSVQAQTEAEDSSADGLVLLVFLVALVVLLPGIALINGRRRSRGTGKSDLEATEDTELGTGDAADFPGVSDGQADEFASSIDVLSATHTGATVEAGQRPIFTQALASVDDEAQGSQVPGEIPGLVPGNLPIAVLRHSSEEFTVNDVTPGESLTIRSLSYENALDTVGVGVHSPPVVMQRAPSIAPGKRASMDDFGYSFGLKEGTNTSMRMKSVKRMNPLYGAQQKNRQVTMLETTATTASYMSIELDPLANFEAVTSALETASQASHSAPSNAAASTLPPASFADLAYAFPGKKGNKAPPPSSGPTPFTGLTAKGTPTCVARREARASLDLGGDLGLDELATASTATVGRQAAPVLFDAANATAATPGAIKYASAGSQPRADDNEYMVCVPGTDPTGVTAAGANATSVTPGGINYASAGSQPCADDDEYMVCVPGTDPTGVATAAGAIPFGIHPSVQQVHLGTRATNSDGVPKASLDPELMLITPSDAHRAGRPPLELSDSAGADIYGAPPSWAGVGSTTNPFADGTDVRQDDKHFAVGDNRVNAIASKHMGVDGTQPVLAARGHNHNSSESEYMAMDEIANLLGTFRGQRSDPMEDGEYMSTDALNSDVNDVYMSAKDLGLAAGADTESESEYMDTDDLQLLQTDDDGANGHHEEPDDEYMLTEDGRQHGSQKAGTEEEYMYTVATPDLGFAAVVGNQTTALGGNQDAPGPGAALGGAEAVFAEVMYAKQAGQTVAKTQPKSGFVFDSLADDADTEADTSGVDSELPSQFFGARFRNNDQSNLVLPDTFFGMRTNAVGFKVATSGENSGVFIGGPNAGTTNPANDASREGNSAVRQSALFTAHKVSSESHKGGTFVQRMSPKGTSKLGNSPQKPVAPTNSSSTDVFTAGKVANPSHAAMSSTDVDSLHPGVVLMRPPKEQPKPSRRSLWLGSETHGESTSDNAIAKTDSSSDYNGDRDSLWLGGDYADLAVNDTADQHMEQRPRLDSTMFQPATNGRNMSRLFAKSGRKFTSIALNFAASERNLPTAAEDSGSEHDDAIHVDDSGSDLEDASNM